MGTHPIFESDFDCLTEMSNLIKRLATVGLKSVKIGGKALTEAVSKTLQQNKERAAAAEAQQAEQAKENQKSIWQTVNRQMGVHEAKKVLDLESIDILDEQAVVEKHEKLIEMNEKSKHPSPYLIAKINNAKEAIIFDIKTDQQAAQNENQSAQTEKDFVEDLESKSKDEKKEK